MKKSIPFFLCFFFASSAFGQNFNGQWKGQFTDNSTSFVGWGGDRCDYVLEIECKGSAVSGYSYTYFNEGGKRFYTICRLSGKLDRANKFIEVREVERTKTNVPNTIRNCFQVHKLYYSQDGNDQTLEGTWIPAPNQEGDCGYGSTSLTRRVLQKNPALFNTPLAKNNKPVIRNTNPAVKSNNIAVKPIVKKPDLAAKNKTVTAPPVVKTVPKQVVPVPITKANPVIIENSKPQITTPLKAEIPEKIIPAINFEKRNNTLLKTIEIESETFKVDLYDNGDIDGDSISLFYNGRLLLQHKRLSDKAISLTLKVDDSKDINELIMYAENLGEIPPNTALMVVTDGDNRYEVRISSDLQKSGVIRFVHKPKNGQ